MRANKKRIIGLTGGIGSGKTTVAKIWKDAFGADIIYTDEISRAVSLMGGSAYPALLSAFPEAFLDGELNRKTLREIVFLDPGKLARLNAVTHPAILNEVIRQIKSSTADTVVVEAPLLFEAGFEKLCDKTVCTVAADHTRIDRICARDGCDRAQAGQIIGSQMHQQEKARLCDFVIDTDIPVAELQSLAKEIYNRVTHILPV